MGQTILVKLAGFFMLAMVFFLLFTNYKAQCALHEEVRRELIHDYGENASQLSKWLTLLKLKIDNLLQQREITAYFENKALGMSEQYGLGLSLLALRNHLDIFWQKNNTAEEQALFYMALVEAEGKMLYEKKSLPFAGAPKELVNSRQAFADNNSFFIATINGQGYIAIRSPLSFHDKVSAQLVIILSRKSVKNKLTKLLFSDRAGEALFLSGRGKVMSFAPSPATHLINQILEHCSKTDCQEMSSIEEISGVRGGKNIVHTPVSNTPFVSSTVLANTTLPTSDEPQKILVIMASLALLIFGTLLIGIRKHTHFLVLAARFEEVENKKMALEREVQKRQKTEAALHNAHKKTTQILSAMHDALIIITPDGTIREVNKGTYKILGYTGRELCGTYFSHLLNEQPASSQKIVELFVSEASCHNKSLDLRHKNGKTIHMIFSAGKIVAARPAPELICLLGKDITTLRRSEAQLERQEQLAHAGRLTALGEMATGIAHELNQPLTIIRLACQWLLKSTKGMPQCEEEKNSLEKIMTQVDRASSIITNMRSFARKSSEDSAPIDLSESVENALVFFNEQFRLHEITFQVDISKDLPKVLADHQKIQQVIVNLLTNARYAVEKKRETRGRNFQATIEVRLFPENFHNKVLVEVADNGIGMDSYVLARCQEPFFTTKEVGQGTGIGLSVSRSIIKEFHGGISVDSVLGEGSRFLISLPACDPT